MDARIYRQKIKGKTSAVCKSCKKECENGKDKTSQAVVNAKKYSVLILDK